MRAIVTALCLGLAGCSAAAEHAARAPGKGSDQAFIGTWIAVGPALYVDRDNVFEIASTRKRADIGIVGPNGRAVERVIVDCSTHERTVISSFGDDVAGADDSGDAIALICQSKAALARAAKRAVPTLPPHS